MWFASFASRPPSRPVFRWWIVLSTVALFGTVGCVGPWAPVDGQYQCAAASSDCPAAWVCEDRGQGHLCYAQATEVVLPDVSDVAEPPPDVADATADGDGDASPMDTTGPEEVVDPPEVWGGGCEVAFDRPVYNAETHVFVSESDDWPDCVAGDCPNAPSSQALVDLRSTASDPFVAQGLQGILDGGSHQLYSGNAAPFEPAINNAPDMDVITIRADARTMIELIAEPLVDGAADLAIITLNDSDSHFHVGAHWATLNDDLSPDDPWARTYWVFPYGTTSAKWHVAVLDARHLCYLNGTPCETEPVGGEDYGYRLWIRTYEFEGAVRDLDEDVAAGEPRAFSGTIGVGGNAVLYRFKAPYTDKNSDIQVSLSKPGASNADFELALFAMDSKSQERMIINGINQGVQHGFEALSLNAGNFNPCNKNGGQCHEDQTYDWYFAVTDWSGRGCGDFDYEGTLIVNTPPEDEAETP